MGFHRPSEHGVHHPSISLRVGEQLNLGAILEVIVVNHHAVLRIKSHALSEKLLQ